MHAYLVEIPLGLRTIWKQLQLRRDIVDDSGMKRVLENARANFQDQEGTKPKMLQLATTTENSKFIDASGGLDSLNEAFEEVAEMITE
jgi:hypothetical protein